MSKMVKTVCVHVFVSFLCYFLDNYSHDYFNTKVTKVYPLVLYEKAPWHPT